MLIGAEHYYSLLLPNQMMLKQGGPVLQNTKLGWIVAGKVSAENNQAAICAPVTTEDQIDTLLERFWTLENLETEEKTKSPIEAHCERHFLGNLQFAADGRFIVKLPFSEQSSALGASQKTATNRFLALERRTSPEVWKGYVDFMDEYESLGHMKEVPPTRIPTDHYFIPHHCVLKPESSTTKLRVVFDASCKTTSNKSLNDILYAGPTVQSELFAILLRFRTHKYVFTADIEKMYRQVWIHPDNQFYQLIVWRKNPSDELKYYRLKTVTYGTTSAPFLATKCLDYLAEKTKRNLPLGAAVVKHDFYVDDCLTGANSIPEAVQIQQELNKILLPAGFKLRNVKTLGLIWVPNKDQLCGRSQKSEASTITKRVVSSEASQIFDPLGLFAPVVVKAKIFMQSLWELKMGWDDELPQLLQTEWKNYRADLQALNNLQIPRHIFDGKVPINQEIHTFVDASERAYGAAIYVRATYKNNQMSVRLLCSKSRVAPTAKETLPRLELCAAVLGAELTHRHHHITRLWQIESQKSKLFQTNLSGVTCHQLTIQQMYYQEELPPAG
ncbi:uncharacterized protein [Drosophila kikkawai]|uniref:Reverse transcriptase domain-containing protein n=1 Tax=Drosophila kikkawai TaxID=30033 RepID=A0ABM4GQ89_DROKI